MLIDKITANYGEDPPGLTFGLWGLAFKPNTDDMREAPSRELGAGLVKHGAKVWAYDPMASDEAQRGIALDLTDDAQAHARVAFVESSEEADADADALVIVSKWKVFKSPNFNAVIEALNEPVVFYGRNLYEPETMAELGIEHYSIDRPYIAAVRKAALKVAQR